MILTALFVLPVYSGGTWERLPHLRRGTEELAALLEDHGAEVSVVSVTRIDDLTTALISVRESPGPLLVYVGGHGIVHARRYYTALDGTAPDAPSSLDALWSQHLAELLAGHGRDVLVVLDSCFAGEGAVSMIGEAASALAELRDARAFGVLASCRALENSLDGLFVERLLELVRGGPQMDVNAWSPGDELIRTGALASELKSAGCHVTGNLEAAELRLFPNPNWNPVEPEGRVNVKAALRRLSRDAGTHLIEKSTGFVGRTHVRREVASWLASPRRGMFVVTGGPGTGKSALIGLLARQSVGDPSALMQDGVPPVVPGTFDVIVHARQKTLEAVRDELSTALEGDKPAVVLVDALDEAVAGEAAGIAAHLASLARRGAATFVVGTRPGSALVGGATAQDALLRELDAPVLHRLDDPHDDSTRADITALVRSVLLESEDSPYRAAGVPIDEIAELTASITTPSFLFAQATARWLCSRHGAISDETDWRRRLTSSTGAAGLGRLVEDDLAARYPRDFERVRDLLRAAAWAEGHGLPRYTIWPSFADELSTTGRTYSDPDLTWLLNEAGWYLTESSEDGQSVYRLFHQALTDHFRAGTHGSDAAVQARLASRLHGIAATAGGWARSDRYVLHYLIAHAEQSDDVSDAPSAAPLLLADTDFVAHADADRLARAVRRRRGRIAGALGPSLERCVHLFGGLTAPERLALLELTCQQEQLPGLSRVAARGAPWWPISARWRPSAPHVTLTGHDDWVRSVAFSPDGATLASAADDGTVRLWDTTTGEHKQTLTGHRDWVRSAAFSPDGATLASAGDDGTVRLWDTATGEHKQTLTGHDDWVWSVAFSPDGATLASAGADGTVRLWDPATAEHDRSLAGHGGSVRSVAFSPDGATLASAGEDGLVRLWDTATREPRRTLAGHGNSVLEVAFSPDSATLASAGYDRTVRLWNTATGAHEQTLTGHSSSVLSVAFSPDGATLASAADDRTVRLWNTATGAGEQTLTGDDSSVLSVAFSPDGATLATASDDSTVKLWTTEIGEHRRATGHDGWVWSVAFSPDGATLASAAADATVRLWDMTTGEPVHVLTGHNGWVRSVAFSPDGATLASAAADATVRVWDAATGEHAHTLTGHDGSVLAVAYSRGSSMLASAGDDHSIRLWDIAAGACTNTLLGHGGAVLAVAFSPDDDTLASAGYDGTIRLWDAETGELRHLLSGHEGSVRSVSFTPSGAALASGGDDGSVRLWNAVTGAHTHTLTGHDSSVLAVAYSPDGATLASAGDDRTVRLWDAARGGPIALMPARSVCNGVAWSRRSWLAIAANAGFAVIEVL